VMHPVDTIKAKLQVQSFEKPKVAVNPMG